eukprot:Amastigsp_a4866_10.p4 type:complete len:147 gc:universal Amastigsp_a4866_10:2130-2570(+)
MSRRARRRRAWFVRTTVAVTVSMTSASTMGTKTQGPTTSHSEPATRGISVPSSRRWTKSRLARSRRAVLSSIMSASVGASSISSPGYSGNRSCVLRTSESPKRSLACRVTSSMTTCPSSERTTGLRMMQYPRGGITSIFSGPFTRR